MHARGLVAMAIAVAFGHPSAFASSTALVPLGMAESNHPSLWAVRAAVPSPDGAHVYAAAQEEISVFRQLPNGALAFVESQVAPPVSFYQAAVVSADGAHVYVGGNGGIAVFARDAGTGSLTLVETKGGGEVPPQGLCMSPDGAHVYALLQGFQGRDLAAYARDAVTGALTLVDTITDDDLLGFAEALHPSPDGAHVYVARASTAFFPPFNGAILTFDRDGVSGALTPGPIFQSGDEGVDLAPLDVAVSPDGAYLYAATRVGAIVFARDAVTGALSLAHPATGPLFWAIALSPAGDHVYAPHSSFVSTVTPGTRVFARDPITGALSLVEIETSDPFGAFLPTTFVAVNPTGEFVYLGGGRVVSLRRDPTTGAIDFADRQGDGESVIGLTGASALALAPGGEHVYATGAIDAGLTVLERDAGTGDLSVTQVNLLTGELAGARGVVVSPDGAHVYAVGELTDTLAAFTRDAGSGALALLEVERDGVGGVTGMAGPRAIAISTDGAHLYVAARGSDAVAVFARDGVTGLLTFVEAQVDGLGGVSGLAGAEDVALSADGAHVYAVGFDAHAVVAFTRDAVGGGLGFVDSYTDGAAAIVGLARPTAVTVSPDGAHVYVGGGQGTEAGSGLVVFTRDVVTGALTFVEETEGAATGTGSALADVVVGPDGEEVYAPKRRVGCCGPPGDVLHRDPVTGQLAFVDELDSTSAAAIGLSPDGAHAYLAAANRVEVYARFSCSPTPLTGCRTSAVPGSAKLILKDKASDHGDRLTWTWKARGEPTAASDFLDPSDATHYALCAYDASGIPAALVGGAMAAAGPRWRQPSAGWSFTDRRQVPEGLKKLQLKANAPGRGVLKLKGQGEHLAFATPPVPLPLRVQLQSAGGPCWETTFSGARVRKNEPGNFVGLSDD